MADEKKNEEIIDVKAEVVDVEAEVVDVKAEVIEKKKVFITNMQAPGDVLQLSAAIRDLVNQHGDKFAVNVSTTAMDIWENNPYLDKNVTEANCEQIIRSEYNLIHRSNTHPWHFIHGFRKDLEEKLDIKIEQGEFKADVHLSDAEKGWMSQIHEITGSDLKYWIIVSGTKSDFTAKAWEVTRYQKLVDHFKDQILFVQVGESGHGHPGLRNVIDLRGKTDTRQLIRLIHHSCGIVCGVTFLMHLAPAIETRSDRTFQTRPAVIIAGGREPAQWEAYPFHQYMNRCSTLKCCDLGGCWKSRVQDLKDGDKEKNESVCLRPVTTKSGQVIPKCLDLISAADVIRAVEIYKQGYEAEGMSFGNDGFKLDDFLSKNPGYDTAKNDNDANACNWLGKIYPQQNKTQEKVNVAGTPKKPKKVVKPEKEPAKS